VILSDEDATTKVINGWKRLNTLAHYGVKDSAVMSLVPRKLTTCTLTNGHCKSSYRNCKCKVVSIPRPSRLTPAGTSDYN